MDYGLTAERPYSEFTTLLLYCIFFQFHNFSIHFCFTSSHSIFLLYLTIHSITPQPNFTPLFLHTLPLSSICSRLCCLCRHEISITETRLATSQPAVSRRLTPVWNWNCTLVSPSLVAGSPNTTSATMSPVTSTSITMVGGWLAG